MSEFKDVFISYSTKDQEAKDFIKQVFDKEGISYFLDEISLVLGEDIEENLEKSLNNTLFTVLLVSKNSLFSTWVCLECVHRLEQEKFAGKVIFLPILIDWSVMDIHFPIEMSEHFKNKRQEIEKLRQEAFEVGLPTKVYNDESERIDKIIPEIGDIISKIKNGLSANFTDESRKEKDLEKLINTIKERKSELKKNDTQKPQKKSSYLMAGIIGGVVVMVLFIVYMLFFSDSSNSQNQNTNNSEADSLKNDIDKHENSKESREHLNKDEPTSDNSDSTKTEKTEPDSSNHQ